MDSKKVKHVAMQNRKAGSVRWAKSKSSVESAPPIDTSVLEHSLKRKARDRLAPINLLTIHYGVVKAAK